MHLVKTPRSFFAMFCKKVTFWGPKKGTLDRRMLSLKARFGGSTFGIPKNRCVKLPVSSSMCPPPYMPPAKMDYFVTKDERTNISCFALSNVMALRAKTPKLTFQFFWEIIKPREKIWLARTLRGGGFNNNSMVPGICYHSLTQYHSCNSFYLFYGVYVGI